jgi:hypothetical protein
MTFAVMAPACGNTVRDKSDPCSDIDERETCLSNAACNWVYGGVIASWAPESESLPICTTRPMEDECASTADCPNGSICRRYQEEHCGGVCDELGDSAYLCGPP